MGHWYNDANVPSFRKATTMSTEQFTMFLLNENPKARIDQERSIVLQPMRDDNIVYSIGPFVIAFDSIEHRNQFFEDGLEEFTEKLDSKYKVNFLPISMNEASNRPEDMVITD
jgi:hypothetical protein